MPQKKLQNIGNALTISQKFRQKPKQLDESSSALRAKNTEGYGSYHAKVYTFMYDTLYSKSKKPYARLGRFITTTNVIKKEKSAFGVKR